MPVIPSERSVSLCWTLDLRLILVNFYASRVFLRLAAILNNWLQRKMYKNVQNKQNIKNVWKINATEMKTVGNYFRVQQIKNKIESEKSVRKQEEWKAQKVKLHKAKIWEH